MQLILQIIIKKKERSKISEKKFLYLDPDLLDLSVYLQNVICM